MAKPSLFSPEIEGALVAVSMLDRDLLRLDVTAADFHDEELGAIWSLAQELTAHGEYLDAVTLDDAIRTRGLSINPARLVLLQAQPDVDYSNGGRYAKRVKDLADRRRALADVEAATRIIYKSNGTWKAEAADVAARLGERVAQPAVSTAQPKRQTSWTPGELYAAEFPEPQWAVPGIIPTGLTFLAGRPKVGKSWFALQVAGAVGTGGMVLDRRITQGKALYLALEDNPRRLRDRAQKQHIPADAAIRFETSWRRFDAGGLDDLCRAILADGITLAVVDTLGRVLGRADQADLADMTDLVGGLQEFAVTHDIAVLVIDHHRKPSSERASDPIDDIVGSTAKSAVADAALGLFTQQGKRGATLKVTGRDVEWQDLALGWDAVTCSWQYEGTAEEVAQQGRRGDVLAVLQEHYPEALTANDIAKLTKMQRANVIPIVNDLVTANKVQRAAKDGKEQPFRALNNG